MEDNKKELNENQLHGISGGSGRRERTLSIEVMIPSFNTDVTIQVYIDGELQPEKTITVDCSRESVTYSFSGTGLKDLKIKFNNTVTKEYSLNFETGEIHFFE